MPDSSNLQATMLIEYPDFVQVAGHAPVFAIADDDLERSTEDKTSAVHFLRFELAAEMIAALKSGAELSAAVDHPHYQCERVIFASAMQESLLNDLA